MPNISSHTEQSPDSEAVSVIKDWVTVETFCKLFPNIPERTLRWQLTRRETNGLHPYVQVIGRRRYISIQGYAYWLKDNAGGSNAQYE